MQQRTKAIQTYLVILTVLGWFALVCQFWININSKAAPVTEIIIRYFSYFTLLTNIIVALCCSALLLKPHSRLRNFFSRPTTLTAVTIYILVVGVVYNTILRILWMPEGLQKIVDELLHTIIPALFLLFWILFVAKTTLKWKNILPWLIYPLVYAIFILIRGAVSGFYPYPFVDVAILGLHRVLLNCLAVTFVFVIFSVLFVSIGKIANKPAG